MRLHCTWLTLSILITPYSVEHIHFFNAVRGLSGLVKSTSSMLNCTSIISQTIQKRNFVRLLTSITNAPDRERIKAVGPNRSCAEWLVRCGATVRWRNADTMTSDFSALTSIPPGSSQYVIEDVEAVEAGIMDRGFEHFDGCKNIKSVRLHHLPYFYDSTLGLLIDYLHESLEHLEITSCGDVTEEGLQQITRLKLLRSLVLQDLPGIRNPEKSYKMLKDQLKQCEIKYNDIQQ